jgi:aspartate aminotransferase
MNGDPELREAIAQQASRIAGTRFTERSVLISHGGAAAITAAILATVNPGDRVVLPEPTYSLYLDSVQLAGGRAVFVPTRPDHHLDLGHLDAALDHARLTVLCNPVNPTGAVFDAAELDWLGRRLSGTDTLVLADEAYADIVYDGTRFTSTLSVPSLRERLIYVQTLSKTYAMTGWRVGYAVAGEPIASAIRQVHRTMNGAAPSTASLATQARSPPPRSPPGSSLGASLCARVRSSAPRARAISGCRSRRACRTWRRASIGLRPY